MRPPNTRWPPHRVMSWLASAANAARQTSMATTYVWQLTSELSSLSAYDLVAGRKGDRLPTA